MIEDRNNRKHPGQSSVGTSFVCSTCERRCKSKAGLAAHQRSHTTAEGTTDNQSRTCRICSKVCKNSTGLKIHMRVHNRWAPMLTHYYILLHLLLYTHLLLFMYPLYSTILLFLNYNNQWWNEILAEQPIDKDDGLRRKNQRGRNEFPALLHRQRWSVNNITVYSRLSGFWRDRD